MLPLLIISPRIFVKRKAEMFRKLNHSYFVSKNGNIKGLIQYKSIKSTNVIVYCIRLNPTSSVNFTTLVLPHPMISSERR